MVKWYWQQLSIARIAMDKLSSASQQYCCKNFVIASTLLMSMFTARADVLALYQVPHHNSCIFEMHDSGTNS